MLKFLHAKHAHLRRPGACSPRFLSHFKHSKIVFRTYFGKKQTRYLVTQEQNFLGEIY